MHDSFVDLLDLNFTTLVPSTSIPDELSSFQPTSPINDVSPLMSNVSLHNSPTQDNIIKSVPSSSSTTVNHPTNLKKSTKVKKIPKYLDAYKTDLPTHVSYVVVHLITNYLSKHQLSPAHKVFTAALPQISEPTSYHEAIKYSHWRDAMTNELKALEDKGTWKIVPLPLNSLTIGSKWINKVKINADGSVERSKACLVAKGYNQRESFNYQETFSLIAKQTTI